MSTDVTQILNAIEQGDPAAASQLLPLVYDELRRLAARKMAHEFPGQTLQPTALVHEAFLRLVGDEHRALWDSRGHFFTGLTIEETAKVLDEAVDKDRSRRYETAAGWSSSSRRKRQPPPTET